MAKTMVQEAGQIVQSVREIASHTQASEPQNATPGDTEQGLDLVEVDPVAISTKRDRLTQLREQFDELTESLARSGKKRNGTTWQSDRLKAREQIRKEMEDLESIPPVPSYNPAGS